jgi:integrase
LTEKIRKVIVYGEKVERTFDSAAARYLEDYGHKKSLDRDIVTIKAVLGYIGALPLTQIHAGSLELFIRDRKMAGISAGTINRDIAIIRRILTLSARLWRDEKGRPWIDTVPMFPMVPGPKRKPRPISHAEEKLLLQALPKYLAEMVQFALHTGLRDQEICGMKWTDETKVQGLDTTVLIITEDRAKNTYERIVPLNKIARSLIASRRGNKSEYIFDLDGAKLSRINNRAWRDAIKKTGLQGVRVHDLRHTFGMRLRAEGVTHEDRQDLLGHLAGRITTHYSRVQIKQLIDCVELLCAEKQPELTLIRNRKVG